jgi:hypothetical protein
MRIRPILQIILLPILAASASQAQSRIDDLGTGTVIIRNFAFGPGLRPAFPIPAKDSANLFMQNVYYVNGDKLFRDDESIAAPGLGPVTRENETGSMIFTFIRPRYLIDWNTKSTYVFSPANDQIGIMALEANDQELFYNNFGRREDVQLNFPINPDTITIAGKTCLAGLMEHNGRTSRFYYTKDTLPLKSPLNGLLPVSFPYAVMAIHSDATWTNEKGQPDIGTSIIQVHAIDSARPDKKWFAIPEGIPMKKIKSFAEFVLSTQQCTRPHIPHFQ